MTGDRLFYPNCLESLEGIKGPKLEVGSNLESLLWFCFRN